MHAGAPAAPISAIASSATPSGIASFSAIPASSSANGTSGSGVRISNRLRGLTYVR